MVTFLLAALSTGSSLLLMAAMLLLVTMLVALISVIWAARTLTLTAEADQRSVHRGEKVRLNLTARHRGWLPIAPLKLQDVSDDQIEQYAIEVYPRLYRAYQDQKRFIPEGNLYEVRFEEFERDAYATTQDIYQKLRLPGWEEAEPAIRAYIESKRGYKKNRYEYKPRTIQLVNEHWGQAIDDWGYERQ